MTKRILICDGDVFAYKACRPRWQTKKKGLEGFVSLDDEGVKIPLEYTKEENAKYLMDSWDNFQKDIKELCEELFIDDYIMAVKGPYNFRDDIYNEYKQKRGANKYHKEMANFVPHIRKLAVQSEMALEAVEREADDYLRIWANEARMHGYEPIIASIDKDLLCIPGLHWRMKERQLIEVTPLQGMRHYYAQLLCGDQVDNIPGLPGIGPIHSERMVQFANTDEECQEIVIANYLASYGEEDWCNQLVSNGKMIHIQEHYNDYFNLKSWPLANELLGR